MSSQHNQTEAAHVSRAAGRDAVRASQRRDHRVRAAEGTPGKKNITMHSKCLFDFQGEKNKIDKSSKMAHEHSARVNARIVAALTAACVCAVWAGQRVGGEVVLVQRADAAAASGKLLSRRQMNEMSLRALRGEHEMLEKHLAQVHAT
jgi:hypothetical protein